MKARRLHIKPRGANQRGYMEAIQSHDLGFGIGPAGTGKTYLAVACAVAALEEERVRRIVLVRPAVEAGERLGFLPGDMSQKVDPYLRPMYDALYEMLGFDRVARLIERSIIEVAPLAFMRGRSLNESFVILDEAQNTTIEQMKMFLTRLGFGSKAVVTGDVTQIDLQKHQVSGLKHAIQVLAGVEGVSFTHFTAGDVVRHVLVQRIVEAYQRFEAAPVRSACRRADRAEGAPTGAPPGGPLLIDVDVQVAADVAGDLPEGADFQAWIEAALKARPRPRTGPSALRLVGLDGRRQPQFHLAAQAGPNQRPRLSRSCPEPAPWRSA